MIKKTKTFGVDVFVAGDISDAKRIIQAAVYPPNEGLCVTVEPVTFIYTGGRESGVRVGFRIYPRFPTTPNALLERATEVAHLLIDGLGQWSAMLVANDETTWISLRPGDAPE